MPYRIKSTLALGVSFPLGDEKYLTLPKGAHEVTVDDLPPGVLSAMQSGFAGSIVVESTKPRASNPDAPVERAHERHEMAPPAPHAPAQDALPGRPPLKK